MSDLSNVKNAVFKDLSSVGAAIVVAFEGSSSTSTAATAAATALQAVENEIPTLAVVGADAALATLGTAGQALTPLVNSYIPALIKELESRLAALV